MRLIVGLGNPGKKYEKNRHNIGFMLLDALADTAGFSPWRSKFQGQISEGKVGSQKILLLKPQTFMNLSGDSVQPAMKFFKSTSQNVLVIHDELDLPPGKLKLKKGGGHAGHNGLRSITQHIGADFWRLRVGIGHPGDKRLVSNYVLSDFAKADQAWINDLIRDLPASFDHLANLDGAKLLQDLGPQPAKNPHPEPKPKKVDEPADLDARSPLQKLMDKFSK